MGSRGRRFAVVGAALVVAALALWMWGRPAGCGEPVTGGEPSAGAAAEQSGADSGPQADLDDGLSWLAPAGHLVRATDATPGDELTLLTADAQGDARLCTWGGHDPEDADTLSCVSTSMERARTWWTRRFGAPEVPSALLARGAQRVTRLGDHLLWVEPAAGGGATLMAGDLEGRAPVEVGALPSGGKHIRGCESGPVLTVVVDGEIVHGRHRVDVAFLDAGGWSVPVSETVQIAQYALACTGRTATITWLSVAGEGGSEWIVHRVECRPQGCTRGEVTLAASGTDPRVTELAGRTLLLRAEGDVTRVRLAPLERLAGASHLEGIPLPHSPVLSRDLWVRGPAAILGLRTERGITAVRIDPDGSVTPLTVRERREPPPAG